MADVRKQLMSQDIALGSDVQASNAGASYWFDGNTGTIQSATSAGLAIGTGDCTFLATIKPDALPPPATKKIFLLASASDLGFLIDTDGQLKILSTASGNVSTGLFPVSNQVFTFAFKRYSNGTKAVAYLNGLPSNEINLTADNLSTGVSVLIGAGSTDCFAGNMYRSIIFNSALSDAQIARYSAGAKLDYADVGGNTTNLLTNGGFETGGNDGWNINGGACTFDDQETGRTGTYNFKCVASAANHGIYSVILTSGMRYNLSLRYKTIDSIGIKIGEGSGVSVKSFPGTSGVWSTAQYTFVSTPGAGTAVVIYSSDATTFYIDDIILTRAGALVAYEPENIYSDKWIDASGNGLHGTVTGAIANNLFSKSGTWTPVDGSGGGVSYTVGLAHYHKIGRMVFATTFITVGTTSDGSRFRISGLPFTCAANSGGDFAPANISYTDYAGAITALVGHSSKDIVLFTYGGTVITNANMSGKQLRLTTIYSTDEV